MAESLRGRWVSEMLPQFWSFCAALKIPSKEEGIIFLHPTSSQVYLITEIFTGLDLGIHDFVIVKSRQLGASTILWALDLWWFLKFGSIQAMYIADDDENKEVHRNILSQMYESLPPK